MIEHRDRCLLIALAALALGACAREPVRDTTAPRPAPVVGSYGTAATIPGRTRHERSLRADPLPGTSVTGIALSMVGTPYLYGGEDPDGFDCSGLVWFAYRLSGIEVPRTALDQYRASRKIRQGDAVPGDLVFFQDQAHLSHVGIYLGDDRFIHAPASGRRVSVASLSEPYFQRHLVGVGRLAEL